MGEDEDSRSIMDGSFQKSWSVVECFLDHRERLRELSVSLTAKASLETVAPSGLTHMENAPNNEDMVLLKKRLFESTDWKPVALVGDDTSSLGLCFSLWSQVGLRGRPSC